MNLFRTNIADSISEFDLIAFHLNELSSRRRSAVEQALRSSPVLTQKADAIADALRSVTLPTLNIDEAVLDRNWEAIRPALAPHLVSPASPQVPVNALPSIDHLSLPTASRALILAAAAAALIFSISLWHGRKEPSASATAAPAVNGRTILPSSSRPISQAIPPAKRIGRIAHRFPTRRSPSSQTLHAAQVSTSLPPAIPPTYSGLAAPPSTSTTLKTHLLSLAGDISPQPIPLSYTAPEFLPPNPLVDAPLTPIKVNHDKQSTQRAHGAGHLTGRDLTFALGGNVVAPYDLLTSTRTAVGIVSFHQQLRPALGYRITAAYTRPAYIYSYATGTNGNYTTTGNIYTHIPSIAGTYAFQGPHHRRLNTSIEAGAALLAFIPAQRALNASYALRPAGVLGLSASYTISPRLNAYLGYRAQIFRSPDFRYISPTLPTATSLVLSNEASVGVTYHFGRR